MKISKKAIPVLAFAVGASVFVSTAFADMLLGSGYDRFKNSIKNTAAQLETGLNSYTIEGLFSLKDNNQLLLQSTFVNKVEPGKSENTSSTQTANGETEKHYSYSDKKLSVWKSGSDDKYYATEYPDDMNRNGGKSFDNPFKEKGAQEVEKIVDAMVGNLKDNVQAEERPEGGRIYSGSLSEAQVPAVVNAVSSFGFKQMIGQQGRMEKEANLPKIESDIFVKKVTGKAVENKAGLLENVTGDIVLTGKDKNGVQHDLLLNVAVKLSDIGNTKVTTPDLTGVNVEKVSQAGGFSSMLVGKYKNNIVIEKNGKYVKIGERNLEITSVEQNKVAGKYYETVKPGFEAEYPDAYNFNFEYNPSQSRQMSLFTYTNSKGEQEQGQLHPSGSGKLYIDLNIEMMNGNSYRSNMNRQNFDGEMIRVFEE
ncbi:hypothetical protein [Paenibacillus thalictri]|uniref:Uncharacterized protein n=1 Tax=Paenibacillus thalictri TaxID=2527873 RepID=A0A4Q9DMT1_9BACL|nr:hypothetical protein [Paenibacillus thalictri]TBL76607.1 hypothetical protein EYB31_19470 [Paenibacillus thalictri]